MCTGLRLMLACVEPSQKGSTSFAEIVGHRVLLSPLHTVGGDPHPLHILGSAGLSRQRITGQCNQAVLMFLLTGPGSR